MKCGSTGSDKELELLGSQFNSTQHSNLPTQQWLGRCPSVPLGHLQVPFPHPKPVQTRWYEQALYIREGTFVFLEGLVDEHVALELVLAVERCLTHRALEGLLTWGRHTAGSGTAQPPALAMARAPGQLGHAINFPKLPCPMDKSHRIPRN